MKHHFIRECIKDETIKLERVNSQENAADIFTKAVPHTTLKKGCEIIGLVNLR